MTKKILTTILIGGAFSIFAQESALPIIAHWSFDNDTQTELVDSGPNKLNAHLKTENANYKILKTQGMKGKALLLENENPVHFVVEDKQKLLDLKPPYTICVWSKPAKLKGKSRRMDILSCKYDRKPEGYILGIGWRRFFYRWGDGKKDNIVLPKDTILKNNLWHHMALVNNGKKITAFVDGNIIFEQEYTNTTPAPGTKKIIGNYPGRADYSNFVGALDELYVIGKALDKDEIYKLSAKTDE